MDKISRRGQSSCFLAFCLFLMLCACSHAKAQDPSSDASPAETSSSSGSNMSAAPAGSLSPSQKVEVIDSLTLGWPEWQTAGINGKLKMAGLPVSPSVRIYMERGKSILISLRAPLVGEVGRAEINDSVALVVNKMGKIYVEEPLAKILSFYPGGISDLQDLLLGHMVFPGSGRLSRDIAADVDVFAAEDGSVVVVPGADMLLPGINYGYTVIPAEGMMTLIAMPEGGDDTVGQLDYTFFENGCDLAFKFISPKKNYRLTLELDNPDWSARPIDPISLNGKYTRVDIDKFMKSF